MSPEDIPRHRLDISYVHARSSKRWSKKVLQILKNETGMLRKARTKGYDDDRASINLPTDVGMVKEVEALILNKRRLKPALIVVVGIGGSNLGTMAVHEAVRGKHHNLVGTAPKVLYADTVDPDSLASISAIIVKTIKQGKTVILNAVSKSGSTTETIANFEVLLDVMRCNTKNAEKYVVVTTDKGSRFMEYAHQNKFSVLTIPSKVGGRYSVFSPVGLFPLGMSGINIRKLIKGASKMRDVCLSRINQNPAAQGAAILASHLVSGRNIADLFLFSNDLESIGKWYRQLMGESIGKEFNKLGKRVRSGMTPTVSIGSTDLHSMAQLYLGGPFDKYTTFVAVKRARTIISVPPKNEIDNLVPCIKGKKVSDIMKAILDGTIVAYTKGKRPFSQVTLPNTGEEAIGEFLQWKMIEMMYLGALLGVNPFDQPNVEDYKKETKKLLAKK